MKRVFFSILAALLITTVSGANVMTMVTTNDNVNISIAGSGAVTIDYGDGTVKKETLSGDNNSDVYNHRYFGTEMQEQKTYV